MSDPSQQQQSNLPGSTANNGATNNKPTLVRRRSLFDRIPQRSRSSLPPPLRFSQNSTLMDNGEENSQLDTDTADASQHVPVRTRPDSGPPSSSLFGAVMQGLGTSSTASALEQDESTFDVPSTPTRHSSSPSAATSTPTRTTTNNTASALMSPSGKSLMNVVHQFVMHSPFRFTSPKPPANPSTPTSHSPRKRLRTYMTPLQESSQSSLHNDNHWTETPLRDGQACLVDWTLCPRLKIECLCPEPNTVTLESFLYASIGPSWATQLRYWSFAPPPSTGSTTTNTTTTTTKASSTLQRMSSVDSSKLSQPAFSRQGSIPLNAKNSPDPAIQAANRQWQQAFRSLFQQWLLARPTLETETGVSPGAPHATRLHDCYFYARSNKETLVLFRWEESTNGTFVPRVLVTNTLEEKLAILNHWGVRYTTVEPPANRGLSSVLAKSNKKPTLSPTVHADLEALRKAQTYGEVPGADVSIRIQTATTKTQSSKGDPSAAVLLSLEGMDNVTAFAEIYRNGLGQWAPSSSSGDSTARLPELLCPMELGPFTNATLGALKWSQEAVDKSTDDTPSISLTLQGPILPSIARRVMGTAVQQVSSMTSGDGTSVVIQLLDDNTPSLTNKLEGTVFNGRHSTTTTETAECRSGTALQLMVWDASRPLVVACKTREVSCF